MIPLRGLADYEEAVEVYRRCQRTGLTVRRFLDYLIATIAIDRARPCSMPTATSSSSLNGLHSSWSIPAR